MNVPVVSHLKLLVNLYNKMNNRFLVLLVIYLIIYLLSVLYKNKQIFCAILLSLLSWERGLKFLCRCSWNCYWWSLLSWERGLKFLKILLLLKPLMSLLSWERGLKFHCCRLCICRLCHVAPLVGAWIEILPELPLVPNYSVAPLVGAWIEISI